MLALRADATYEEGFPTSLVMFALSLPRVPRFIAILVSSLPRALILSRDPRFLASCRFRHYLLPRALTPFATSCFLATSHRSRPPASSRPHTARDLLLPRDLTPLATSCFLATSLATSCFLDEHYLLPRPSTLDEMLAAVQLASFEFSNSPTSPTSPVGRLSALMTLRSSSTPRP